MISEHDEQSTLIQWAKFTEHELPELKLLHAIPNGGWRHKATAARLKREGLKPGIPDLCLPVPRGQWHGCYIEMKSIVCKGFNQAVDAILAYLALDESGQNDRDIANREEE
jgi:hypothetical protein